MSPAEQMARMIGGFCISQAVYVAAKLGVADLLQDGPRSVTKLAREASVHEPSLYRLLRMLASLGIFAEETDRRFRLTPLAEQLRSGPGSQRAMAIMMGEEHYQAYGNLLYSVQTGRMSFDKIYGMPVFDFLSQHPEKAAVFDAAMTEVHGRETDLIVHAYDFSSVGTLVDIGGGNGSVLMSILKQHPRMRGILFDLPHVIDRARSNIGKAGLGDRCELVAGSFFERVPEGADAYLMRHIIHDWDDEKCGIILQNISRAMKQDSRVLVAESIIPPGNDPFLGKLLDITMLVLPGGQERTEGEYRNLFQTAGLRLSRIVPTSSEISVLECVAD